MKKTIKYFYFLMLYMIVSLIINNTYSAVFDKQPIVVSGCWDYTPPPCVSKFLLSLDVILFFLIIIFIIIIKLLKRKYLINPKIWEN